MNDRKASTMMPTLFVPHGGGPWPFVDVPGMSEHMGPLRSYLESIPASLPGAPKALLVISAHWEEAVPTVQTSPHPRMLYDYGGFPPASYEITWPAPGSAEIAHRVRELLDAADIESAEDAARGFDHGTFVVTKLMYPEAEIPTLQLSLTSDLDPKRLYKIGQALSPLREAGVLILGSGYSYHNMRGFFSALRGDPRPREDARYFDAWLSEALTLPPDQRTRELFQWQSAPRARACHPREEHLLPLFVCAGAAGSDDVTLPFHENLLGLSTLAARFG